MKDESTMIRIDTKLKERLDGVRERMISAARKRPHHSNPKLTGGVVSYSDVIEELAGRYLTHIDRNRYYQERLRKIIKEEKDRALTMVQRGPIPDDTTVTLDEDGEVMRMEWEGCQQQPKQQQ